MTGPPAGTPVRVRPTPLGRPAGELVGRAVAEAQGNDPLTPVLVIVPDPLTGVTVRRSLAAAGGIAAIRTLTLPQLAEELAGAQTATAAQGLRLPLTPAVLAAWMRGQLLREPGIFGEVAAHPATARALARAAQQLRTLGPEQRRAVDAVAREAAAAGDALPGVALALSDAAHAELAPGFVDATTVLEAAVARLRGTGEARRLVGADHVLVHLPGPLSWREQELLRALADALPLQILLPLSGSATADARVRTDTEAVLGRALTPEEAAAPQPPQAGTIMHASDPDDEVRSAVRGVIAALADHPAHRIGVLFTAAQPYARILHEQLRAAGICFSGPGSRPAAERGAGRLLRGLLALQAEDFGRAHTLDVLASLPLRDLDGRRIPVATWERLSREAGIVAGADWEERTARRITELEGQPHGDGSRAERDASRLRSLRAVMGRLRRDLAAVAAAPTWARASALLRGLLDDLVAEDALGDGADPAVRGELHTLAVARRAVDDLAALDGLGAAPTLAALTELCEEALAAATLRQGRFGEGIVTAGLEAAAGLDLDVVWVLGASEDLCPGRPAPEAVLNEQMREASGGALPTVAERTAALERALLTALAAPCSHVSFSRGDLRDRSGRIPSRWLMPSIRALSGDAEAVTTDYAAVGALTHHRSFLAALAQTDLPASEQEWRVRHVLAHPDRTHYDDQVTDAGLAVIAARRGDAPSRFDGFIGAAEGLSLTAGEQLSSATALEAYVACPHSYFVQHVLRVRPLEEPEAVQTLSALDQGTLIHAALDALIREAAERGELPDHGQPWTAQQHERLAQLAADIADTYEQQGITGPPRLWARTRARLLEHLDAALTQDSQWRARRDLAVCASEVAFGTEEAPPLEIPLPGQGVLRMRGSADKVDRGPDGSYVITDVKTGRSAAYTGIATNPDPTLGGTRLQLPVYARALRALYGLGRKVPVTARYWFTAEGTEVEVPVDSEVDERFTEVLTALAGGIGGGIFPARPPANETDRGYTQCIVCNPDGRGYAAVSERWNQLSGDPEVRHAWPAWDALLAVADPTSSTGEPA